MTKEEILRKNIGLLPYINSYEKSNSIFDAMSEYAKQQSIEFFKWYGVKMMGFLEYLKEYKPLIVSNEIESALKAFEGQTFDELYNLFLDHQLKQQP